MKVPILATRAAERSQPSAAVRNPAGKYHSSKSREGRLLRCFSVDDLPPNLQSFNRHRVRFLGSQRNAAMSHAYGLNEEVLHRGQGPQGRLEVEEPKVYTIIRYLPVEADGRLRYRIKSEKDERVVTEDELSHCH